MKDSPAQPSPSAADNHDPAHEDRLWLLAAQRNPALFERVYQHYVHRVYAYCLRRVDDIETAEDLTAHIFARALHGVGEYRGGSVAAWLFQIAHRQVANHYRGRKLVFSLDAPVPTTLEDEATLGESLTDDAQDADPLAQVIALEEQAAVLQLVQTLSDHERNLLLLKVVGGLSADAIGRIVGKSAGAVRVDLHRIMKRLRAQAEETS